MHNKKSSSRILNGILGLLIIVVFLTMPNITMAGGGSISIVTDGDGKKAGEINLIAYLTFDPQPGDMEKLKKNFMTSSFHMCDVTDGKFRLGSIVFTTDPADKSLADIWLYKRDDRSKAKYDGSFGIGKKNMYIEIFNALENNKETSGTITHELGHYVFGLEDQYSEKYKYNSLCDFGAGFENDTDPEVTVMQNHKLEKCHEKQNGNWVNTGTSCYGVEDCVSGAFNTWGEGKDNDNVKCAPADGIGTELSVRQNHDFVNGLESWDTLVLDTNSNFKDRTWGDGNDDSMSYFDQFYLSVYEYSRSSFWRYW